MDKHTANNALNDAKLLMQLAFIKGNMIGKPAAHAIRNLLFYTYGSLGYDKAIMTMSNGI